ncbi:MAG: L-histidine N(alpha)-methyltransferase [Candidatus Marinimicrobia bacterium]|nr:L-histidine N(alpha)-methyltransferase [Candidatus Neomarinimicrobiota bacterium]
MNLQTITDQDRCKVQILPAGHREDTVSDIVRAGLSKSPKTLPPILFYDEEGSRLFEKICEVPEYYLTRTEQSIFDEYGKEMVDQWDSAIDLVELGSGNSAKTRTLLSLLLDRGHEVIYRPIDISQNMLQSTAEKLTAEFPTLHVEAIVGDYHHGLQEVGKRWSHQKVFLFMGSNLGNFQRSEAEEFLADIRSAMAPDDLLLLGIDLVKPVERLLAAYDDAAGVTRAFNLNLLTRLNRELNANFNPDQFEHVARWDAEASAIQTFLVSRERQTVVLGNLNMEVTFEAGEALHTESSHKYTLEGLSRMVDHAGLDLVQTWTDSRQWFALNLLRPGGR